MPVSVSDEENKEQHRPEPPMKEPRRFPARGDDCAKDREREKHER